MRDWIAGLLAWLVLAPSLGVLAGRTIRAGRAGGRVGRRRPRRYDRRSRGRRPASWRCE